MENFYLNFLIMKNCLRGSIDWTLRIYNTSNSFKNNIGRDLKEFKD